MKIPFKAARNVVTSKLGRQILLAQKSSPGLLFAAGTVGLVATVVTSSKATLRVSEALEEVQHDEDTVKLAKELARLEEREYSNKDYAHDLTIVKCRKAVVIAKVYALPVTLGVLTIGAFGSAHYILNQRNAALAAAYLTLDKGFRDYRSRVAAEYGHEKEAELRYGVEEREVVEETEQGPEVKLIRTASPNASIYARVFDRKNKNWEHTQPEMNYYFIQLQQQWANDQLNVRGHIFLNEVYDMLGIDRVPEGQVVGWVLDKADGENFVDFGIVNLDSDKAREFASVSNGGILLDFNVDGEVYKLI